MRKEDIFKETIDKVMSGLNERLTNKNKSINKAWSETIDKNIKKHTKVAEVKDKVLYIKAESPAWIYEIKSKKKEIIEKINHFHTKEVLKDIKIKLGDI